MTNDDLPDFPPDEVRAPDEVAKRALALFSVVGLAFGAKREEVIAWIAGAGLRDAIAPSESAFIDAALPSEQQIVNASWMSERLIVLLWALGHIERLPGADEQCDTAVFQAVLPPYAPVSVEAFVGTAKLRPEGELIEMADEILNLHWQARDAKLRGGSPRMPVDIEIIQERHHAINWVIGYDGVPWDEVTTDT